MRHDSKQRRNEPLRRGGPAETEAFRNSTPARYGSYVLWRCLVSASGASPGTRVPTWRACPAAQRSKCWSRTRGVSASPCCSGKRGSPRSGCSKPTALARFVALAGRAPSHWRLSRVRGFFLGIGVGCVGATGDATDEIGTVGGGLSRDGNPHLRSCAGCFLGNLAGSLATHFLGATPPELFLEIHMVLGISVVGQVETWYGSAVTNRVCAPRSRATFKRCTAAFVVPGPITI